MATVGHYYAVNPLGHSPRPSWSRPDSQGLLRLLEAFSLVQMPGGRLLIAFSLLILLLLSCVFLNGTGSLIEAAHADVNYFYDEAGRLTGVVAPSGASAQYNYDAAGNVVSIGSIAAGTVSINQFTPNSGPAGTTVTIYGTGFSATPSQNTVKFNGTTAVVSSATATQIATQVPAGATTGPISVTTPSGNATSSTPFTVASQAPTITGFTPTIGTAGTAVTLSGTNFMTLANDKVAFNTHYATLSSATSTTIGVAVPAATGSGRIAVTTPYGKAVSSSDFFIPPAPYTAADIAVTGRMAIGDTNTVTIAAAGKNGLIVFDGSAGQRVSIQATGSTFASCVNVTIYKPDNTTLATTCLGAGGFIDPPAMLPQTGTYAIFVSPQSTQTGNITLNLFSVPPDATGTISIDGPAVTVSTTTAGQNASLTFSGSAGQRIALSSSASSYANSVYVTIYKPAADGSASTSSALASFYMSSGSWTDVVSLPSSGTYTIVINPQTTNTGSITFSLASVPPDATGTITINGPAVGVTTTGAGQNANVTFSGTAGQQATVHITSSTFTQTCVTVSLLDPGNSYLTSVFSCSQSFNLPTQTMSATGTYSVYINPSAQGIGSMNVNVTSP